MRQRNATPGPSRIMLSPIETPSSNAPSRNASAAPSSSAPPSSSYSAQKLLRAMKEWAEHAESDANNAEREAELAEQRAKSWEAVRKAHAL